MKPIIRPLSTLLLGGIYLGTIFFPFPQSSFWISLFALIALLSFFPYLKRVPRALIFTLTAGTLLMNFSTEGFAEFFFGLQTNASVLAIFIFVPLLAIPIQQGNYLKYIDVLFSFYIKQTHHLYLLSTISVFSIGSIMNVGSIPILYQLTDTESFQAYKTTRVNALSRGFVLSFIWSPYFISVGLILTYFHVSWIELFPIGFSLALVIALTGFWMERGKKQAIPLEELSDNPKELATAKRKVYELLSIVGTITGIIMAVEHYTPLSVLTAIPLIVIVASFVWSAWIGTIQEVLSGYRSFFRVRIPAMGNELSLFIIAGAFGAALLRNGADEWIVTLLKELNITHVLMLIPLLLLLLVVPALIGVHPIISATVLAITLSQSPLFSSDHLYLSLGLLSSWMVAILVSPFSGLTLLLAAISGKSSFEIGLKNNGGFGLLLWGICYAGIVVLYYVL